MEAMPKASEHLNLFNVLPPSRTNPSDTSDESDRRAFLGYPIQLSIQEVLVDREDLTAESRRYVYPRERSTRVRADPEWRDPYAPGPNWWRTPAGIAAAQRLNRQAQQTTARHTEDTAAKQQATAD